MVNVETETSPVTAVYASNENDKHADNNGFERS